MDKFQLTCYCRKHIQFQPFTPKDIVRISEVEISATELYKNHENGIRTTAEGGALDGRMVRYNTNYEVLVLMSTYCDRDRMTRVLAA